MKKVEKLKRICLCEYCIEEIRSKGESVFKSDLKYDAECSTCEWCGEKDDVFECLL